MAGFGEAPDYMLDDSEGEYVPAAAGGDVVQMLAALGALQVPT
jgi:hypothetical protein